MANKPYRIEDEFDELLDSLTASTKDRKVRVSVKKPVSQPIKVPPPVAAKPVKKGQPYSTSIVINQSANQVPPPVLVKPGKKVRTSSASVAGPSDGSTYGRQSSSQVPVHVSTKPPAKVHPSSAASLVNAFDYPTTGRQPPVKPKPYKKMSSSSPASAANTPNDFITVNQRSAPLVAVKPVTKVQPPSASVVDLFADIPPPPPLEDFPPPPPEELPPPPPPAPAAPAAERTVASKQQSIEDQLDALTDTLAMCLENKSTPDAPTDTPARDSFIDSLAKGSEDKNVPDSTADNPGPSPQNTDKSDSFGICGKCGCTIEKKGFGYTAVGGNRYHVACFVCAGCAIELTGMMFYTLNDAPHCEKCYNNSREDCIICKGKITQRILKAVGNSYHPECFACVGCGKSLDGITFTLDTENIVHCVECYQLKFSPKCDVCEKLILPCNEEGETVHIVSMEKNFHLECYKCEDCDVLLSSEDGQSCYPLDGHILCKECNVIRNKARSLKV